ncbi:polar amino acid transport system substrate-binding protein [Pelomonas saccharophila]|uniref:Polar amino acid transport system substrate-binding protein n=1 Tax=Roseateles saccharophilus TaxID=304 RepID=A0ABU1YMT0_ROSSA|nr:transporter substrate-binding domain-containing protein [Roseateles saccharophilus]MDR7270028.1 polar amino acid transport system substrate-binding protein [Roseateles saccharophilus]
MALLTACAATRAAAADLVLYYEERPPLMSRQDNQLTGVQGAPAMAVLQRAGITVELREAPVARQMAMITRNVEPACALGLYRTAEREKVGKYSRLPVYSSPPQSLMIRRDGRLKDIHRFATAVQSPTITLALRLGYSYGAETDKALAESSARIVRSSDHSMARARLVLMGIADAALFTEEEGEALIKQLGEAGAALELRRLPDAPPGEGRFFFCNKALPDRQMRAIDDVMAASR